MRERIIKIRKALDMSQEKFCEKLSFSRSGLANIESGKNSVNDRLIYAICKEYDVNEDYIRYGKEPMFRQPSTVENELAAKIAEVIKSDDEWEKNMILKYLQLPQEKRNVVKEFLKSIQ